MPDPQHQLKDLAESWSETLRILSDPTRLRLLLLIHYAGNGALTIGELAEAAELKMATASAALRLMALAGVVEPLKHGREVRYRLTDERTHQLLHYLGGIHSSTTPTPGIATPNQPDLGR